MFPAVSDVLLVFTDGVDVGWLLPRPRPPISDAFGGLDGASGGGRPDGDRRLLTPGWVSDRAVQHSTRAKEVVVLAVEVAAVKLSTGEYPVERCGARVHRLGRDGRGRGGSVGGGRKVAELGPAALHTLTTKPRPSRFDGSRGNVPLPPRAWRRTADMYVGSNERRTRRERARERVEGEGGLSVGDVVRGSRETASSELSRRSSLDGDRRVRINFAVTGPRRMGCNLRRAESHARHSRRCEPARVFELCPRYEDERHVFAFGWSPARPDDAINLPCLSNRPTTRDVTRCSNRCVNTR